MSREGGSRSESSNTVAGRGKTRVQRFLKNLQQGPAGINLSTTHGTAELSDPAIRLGDFDV